MATVPRQRRTREIEYSIGDGQILGETELHRQNAIDLIRTLEDHFAAEPSVCVAGGLLIFYEQGDPKKRVAPDVFVVQGVEKRKRDHFLIWEEGKGPDLIIELTSKQRSRQDRKKIELYRDVLKVPELFLIDPSGGCFDSPLQGFRWSESGYVPIQPVRGPGLHSKVLGLNLAREGYALRVFDPDTGRKLPTIREEMEASESMRVQFEKARRLIAMELELAEMRRQLAENSLKLTEAQHEQAEAQLEQLAAENERLRQENEALLRR
ncbi:MAG: Uma2 family endonuclease [Isosphaeraceae bacterium]